MEYSKNAADLATAAFHEVERTASDIMDANLFHQDSPFSPVVGVDLLASMPDLTSRLPHALRRLSFSKGEPVDLEKDNVWLFDNTAFQIGSQDADALEHRDDDHSVKDHVAHPKAEKGSKLSPPAWQTEIVAAYFIKNSGRDLSVVVAEVAKKLGIAEGDAARHTIQERISPFVNTILSHHTIRVSIGDVELQTSGPSNSCGISSALHNVHVGTHQSAALTLGVKEDMGSVLEGVTHFASPTGWGIISDIDDTIKVTSTPEELGISKSTFVDEPEPISGMPELYSHMASLFSNPPFFYLSASPYNSYPFSRSFRSQYYPAGTTILRDASWQNLGGSIASLTQGVQEYKVDRIKKIHAWFPSRRWICIGDSTQKDPESYGEIARTYPGWVKAIFIRKVSGVVDPGQPSEAERNSDERFAKAFKGLDSSLWTVFTDPQEVRQKVDALATNGS